MPAHSTPCFVNKLPIYIYICVYTRTKFYTIISLLIGNRLMEFQRSIKSRWRLYRSMDYYLRSILDHDCCDIEISSSKYDNSEYMLIMQIIQIICYLTTIHMRVFDVFKLMLSAMFIFWRLIRWSERENGFYFVIKCNKKIDSLIRNF